MSGHGISFLVATFRMAPYVTAMLNSVLGAMQAGDELIIVDDGSTDGTNTICRDWLRRHCPDGSLIEQANQGVCASRNAALSRAQKNYVLFLDGDDELIPTTIHGIRDILANLRPDVVEFDFDYWQPESQNPLIRSPAKSHQSETLITSAEDILCATLNDRAWALWGRLISRSIFISAPQPFFPTELTIDDLPSTPCIAARAKSLYYHREPIIKYRQIANSLSKQRSAAHCLDIAISIAVAKHGMFQHPLTLRMEDAIRLWAARMFYESLRMARQSPERNHALFEQIYQLAVAQLYPDLTELYESLQATGVSLDRKIAREINRFDRWPYLQAWFREISSYISQSL